MELSERVHRLRKRALLGFVVVIVLGICGVGIFRWQKHRQVERELARIKAAGEPSASIEIERAELQRATNSADQSIKLAIRSFIQSTNAPFDKVRDDWKDDRAFTPGMREQLRWLLATNEQTLIHLGAALTNETMVWKHQWTAGFAMMVPHLAQMKSFSSLLGSSALLEIEQGNQIRAQHRIDQTLRLARLMEEEPMFISQLVRFAILSVGLEMLEHLLWRFEPDESWVRQEQSLLRQAAEMRFLRRALFTERVAGLEYYEIAPTAGGMPSAGQVGFAFLKGIGWVDADKVMYLQTMRDMIEVCDLSYPEVLLRAQAVQKNFENNIGGTSHESEAFKAFQFRLPRVSAMIVPALASTFEKQATVMARCRMGIAALELNLIRRETGQYPTALPLDRESIRNDLMDPFTGRPLRLNTLANGFLVYSAGPDRTDDDGARRVTPTPAPKGVLAQTKSEPKKGYDLVFEVRRQ